MKHSLITNKSIIYFCGILNVKMLPWAPWEIMLSAWPVFIHLGCRPLALPPTTMLQPYKKMCKKFNALQGQGNAEAIRSYNPNIQNDDDDSFVEANPDAGTESRNLMDEIILVNGDSPGQGNAEAIRSHNPTTLPEDDIILGVVVLKTCGSSPESSKSLN